VCLHFKHAHCGSWCVISLVYCFQQHGAADVSSLTAVFCDNSCGLRNQRSCLSRTVSCPASVCQHVHLATLLSWSRWQPCCTCRVYSMMVLGFRVMAYYALVLVHQALGCEATPLHIAAQPCTNPLVGPLSTSHTNCTKGGGLGILRGVPGSCVAYIV
jgi:hypothetical protein